ncbi:haloalkane dehalogenase [Pseudoalteromonas denitrificans]|uniref:Haloalkane dehalogenase n=1 Tax=Pseudoalteromonas denitrificans DSM 6059 TaxID=1123010 RepID=A0A1I1I5M7_9GAMM|nr:haloalkane dehalogenase [Pseudoalteromonas denitrificans]SFC31345.1 haloalkane dehalogenase [Pseudoalteromonas denitrificans DSM 6059]
MNQQINNISSLGEISSAFDFHRQYIDINDQKIHYIEKGNGDPILFIHGCPTSSYLWRNIIPFVSNTHKAVAFDLIGMGGSNKPKKPYTFIDNYRVLEGFIDALGLKNITLVVHDWGAALGFEYARKNTENVKAIAFMEAVLPPIFPQVSYDAMGEEIGALFKSFRDPIEGVELLINQHMFIEKTLPDFILRPLDKVTWDQYKAPFLNQDDRTALLTWPKELPIAGEPKDNVVLMADIEAFMCSSQIPMLLLYSDPGILTPPELVPWYQENIKNLSIVHVGKGLHFIQEDEPILIGEAIAHWLVT